MIFVDGRRRRGAPACRAQSVSRLAGVSVRVGTRPHGKGSLAGSHALSGQAASISTVATAAAQMKRHQAEAVASALSTVPDVVALAIFGSVARGRAKATSDIDMLVLTTNEELTAGVMRGTLPSRLHALPISLYCHTPHGFQRYMHRWPRFAAHLRQEAEVVYDPRQVLSELFALNIPVSTAQELKSQRQQLDDYMHVERFGGRLLFPLAHLYRIGRTVAFVRLAEAGHLVFDRDVAFEKLASIEPKLRWSVEAVAALAPFYERVRADDPQVSIPFSPVGESAERRFLEARAAIEEMIEFQLRANV